MNAKPTLSADDRHRLGRQESPEAVIAVVAELLARELGADLRSIYLTGSRAAAAEIATSDLDLCLVLAGRVPMSARAPIRELVVEINRASPVSCDAVLVDEAQLEPGLTPYLQCRRLLAGPDVLLGRPLLPKPGVMLHFATLGLYSVRAVRGHCKELPYPLTYPEPDGEFFGYDRFGVRLPGGGYRTGWSSLVNLVLTLATFRLAWLADVYTPAKRITVAEYPRHLPNDPWLDLVAGVASMRRWGGADAPPGAAADRARVAAWCEAAVRFENEFLDTVIEHLPEWLPADEPEVVAFAALEASRLIPAAGQPGSRLSRLRERIAALRGQPAE